MKAEQLEDLDTSGEVLDFLRTQQAEALLVEAAAMVAAVKYCGINTPTTDTDAAGHWFGDRSCALAGEGAPQVSESAVIEYAAALGRSTESAKKYLGECLELAHRLRKTWTRVRAGEVPGWAARRIASQTMKLPQAGAAWVDGQVAPAAGRIGPTALDRILNEALTRFDPEEAEQRRLDGLEGRRVDIDLDDLIDGQVCHARVNGVIDAADALDLQEALTTLAAQYRELGSTESLNVRRAKALGELARTQLHLHLDDGDGDSGGGLATPPHKFGGTRPTNNDGGGLETPPGNGAEGRCLDTPPRSSAALDHRSTAGGSRSSTASRRVVLHVHLSADAVQGYGDGIARVETLLGQRDRLVTFEQLTEWCAGAQITVQPVLDLHETLMSTGYQPAGRLRDQVVGNNPTCVFPFCHRPARTSDLDHIEPWRDDGGGGRTDSTNLAPLCRTHHRAKTHLGWTYTMLIPGEYLWTSPQGRSYHRGPDGSSPLDPPRDTPRP
ncbi:HNH endonuclease signature motif containing protein [Nocardioides limicola]|uniref:HNH endonuclease signature motif containing protein n=2 Tax=Nocardioides limicola TaxID=2803368 RepID=UPI00193C7049|nr:HNH endonuclease signature motif containing protein [Nocardioides sp. DJM-14]